MGTVESHLEEFPRWRITAGSYCKSKWITHLLWDRALTTSLTKTARFGTSLSRTETYDQKLRYWQRGTIAYSFWWQANICIAKMNIVSVFFCLFHTCFYKFNSFFMNCMFTVHTNVIRLNKRHKRHFLIWTESIFILVSFDLLMDQ